MKTEQLRWSIERGWTGLSFPSKLSAHLVLVFGEKNLLKTAKFFQPLKDLYPKSTLLGCSTAGEIYGAQVVDGEIIATAIEFEHTEIQGNCLSVKDYENSFAAGAKLGQTFDLEGLVHLFLLTDGLAVNGSELIAGLRSQLPESVKVTGGMAGDGSRFEETLVIWNDLVASGLIAAIGLYGDRIKVGYGSLGGWTTFGPKRMVTKSQGNVLYEFDGVSALDIYKKYLGEYALGLPATGLLFPLSLYNETGDRSVVRTILAVDETEKNLTFAGDIPENSIVQMMQFNFDRLVDGAIMAAQNSLENISASPDLAILISCVGRKMVLKQRIEEEVEGVQEVVGLSTMLAGFYSYGEIAPTAFGDYSELHNQTMTITTFLEQ